MTSNEIIASLGMRPLPREGGFFAETYRSEKVLNTGCLPGFREQRTIGGAIYYLVTHKQFSALHRLPADEIYYYHYGDPLELLLLSPDGTGAVHQLGMEVTSGQRPQLLAPANYWQGSRPLAGRAHGFTLVSTSMAPAYEENDPEFGQRRLLTSQYPTFEDIITGLTRS